MDKENVHDNFWSIIWISIQDFDWCFFIKRICLLTGLLDYEWYDDVIRCSTPVSARAVLLIPNLLIQINSWSFIWISK